MLLGATALVAIAVPVAVTTVSAGGPASAAVALNPVGTYNHLYVNGNMVGTETLYADHTMTSSAGPSGYWTASGKSIAITATVGETFVGTISSKGISSGKKPGSAVSWAFGTSTGIWYATWS